MTQSIWKYQIPWNLPQVIMPRGAKILTVKLKGADLCVWAVVDREAPTVTHTFHIIGTGWISTDELPVSAYLGTVQELAFVWHVFDGGEKA